MNLWGGEFSEGKSMPWVNLELPKILPHCSDVKEIIILIIFLFLKHLIFIVLILLFVALLIFISLLLLFRLLRLLGLSSEFTTSLFTTKSPTFFLVFRSGNLGLIGPFSEYMGTTNPENCCREMSNFSSNSRTFWSLCNTLS